jgi:hypothetical protein
MGITEYDARSAFVGVVGPGKPPHAVCCSRYGSGEQVWIVLVGAVGSADPAAPRHQWLRAAHALLPVATPRVRAEPPSYAVACHAWSTTVRLITYDLTLESHQRRSGQEESTGPVGSPAKRGVAAARSACAARKDWRRGAAAPPGLARLTSTILTGSATRAWSTRMSIRGEA